MTNSGVVASRVSKPVGGKRKALLVSCATAAIAVGVSVPQQARAQAFSAPTIPEGQNIAATGTATRTFTSGTTETITIGSNKALINWTPDESGTGPTIDFLQSGNVATFQGGVGLSDYTVLNRVVPDGSRAISLNGEVRARLDGGATGGRIWFYSPNGIVVGSTAVFDVGSLLLTANDPLDFTTSTDGFGRFKAIENSTASVEIGAGARITASPENSYVALIAPRVVQAGDVRVNGAAAYVGAEDVVMTLDQGLFDIEIDIGTADGNGVVHSGSTGGPSSTGTGDNHRVYMVAVPKNEALTMLLSGDVGFDAAASASIENGEILLRSGWNTVAFGSGDALTDPSALQANLEIGPGNYTSDLSGVATGNIFAIADTGSMNFAGDFSLASYDGTASAQVHVGATGGNDITVGGYLWLDSRPAEPISEVLAYVEGGSSLTVGGFANLYSFDENGGSGGTATLSADGGSISIAGQLQMAAPGYISGADSPTPQSAVGGTVNLTAANGGTISTGNLLIDASGDGQRSFIGGPAGSGTGGDVFVVASSGGGITVNGDLTASANGKGGDFTDGFTSEAAGGFGQGGDIRIGGDGGTISVTGSLDLSAGGTGGSYTGEATEPVFGFGGGAAGGWARMETTDAGSTITIGGDVDISASASGGSAIVGGDAQGGSSGMESLAGEFDITGSITMTATGNGGNAYVGFGGSGGDGQGGGAYIQATGTASITGGNSLLDVTGTGGYGGDGYVDPFEGQIAAGSGGLGQGGFFDGTLGSGGAFVLSDAAGANVDLGDIQLLALGTGGFGGEGGTGQVGGAGGDAFGGTVQAGSFDPGQTGATVGTASFGNVDLNASAHGGAGGAGDQGNGGAAAGDGGNATGGGSYTCGEAQNFCGGAFLNAKGTVEVGNVVMNADGTGGAGATGGNALGGYSAVEAFPDSSITGTAGLQLSARGVGGAGIGGSGGDGEGGWVELLTSAGSAVSFAGAINMYGGGEGGIGTTSGGDGTGGVALVSLDGGSLSGASMQVFSNGAGGAGAVGGNAFGNDAVIQIGAGGGILNVAGHTQVHAQALGGNGGGNGGTGGAGGLGEGGNVVFEISPELNVGATVDVNMGDLTLLATSQGGDGGSDSNGGAGGAAQGGTSTIELANGTVDMGTMTARTNAVGGAGGGASSGAGGTGGAATGGTATLNVGGPATLTAVAYSNTNSVSGGAGGTGTTPGAGGTGTGGSGSATIDGSATFTITTNPNAGFVVTAFAEGGEGGSGGAGLAGTANVLVNGTLSSAGVVQVTARSEGGHGTAGAGGNSEGGSATLTVAGELLDGNVVVATTTTGGNGSTTGGDAFGTGAQLLVTAGGDLNADSVTISTDAIGGQGVTAGGNASHDVEEIAYFQVDPNSSANVTGAVAVWANATGGTATGPGGIGGQAAAGHASIDVFDGSSLTVGGDTTLHSMADGGVGSEGGNASGGVVGLGIYGSGTADLQYLNLNVSGEGGAGTSGSGGAGTSNLAVILVEGDLATADLDLRAYGIGGAGGNGVDGGDGGAGTAGDTTITVAAGGSIDAGNIFSFARGFGGDGGDGTTGFGGDGGNAVGGTSYLTVAAGGTLDAAIYHGSGNGPNGFDFNPQSQTFVSTGGNGGTGASGSGIGGSGNSAAGVGATIDGTATIAGDFIATTFARGGDGSIGGNADAGDSTINVGGSLTVGGRLQATASAIGGNSDAGAGGSASAGDGAINVNGSASAGSVLIGTVAVGGNGTSAGGDGFGGNAALNVSGTATVTNSATVEANGTGGNASAGVGGDGFGGYASVNASSGGSLTVDDLFVRANGSGGDGVDGGDGYAGAQTSEALAGAWVFASGLDSLAVTGVMSVEAKGFGGDATSGTGGSGYGGDARFLVAAGGSANVATPDIVADGFGGHSATGFGGDADAGFAEIEVQGSLVTSGETWVSSESEGGDGGAGGGNGYGGEAHLQALFGGSIQLGVSTNVEAEGSGGLSTNGDGGDGYGGVALVDANQGGTITAHNLTASASGEGSTGVNGGDGYGAYPSEIFAGAFVEAIGAGSAITLTGLTTIEARGEGGVGTSTDGSGSGGYATLYAEEGSIDAEDVLVDASAVLGSGSGGFAGIEVYDGTITAEAATLVSNGASEGGEVRIRVETTEVGGSLALASLNATANGGAAAGDVLVDVAAGSTADFGNATLTSNGGVPLSGEDGIELDIVGDLTAANLQLTSSDDIQINTHFGGTITVAGTLAADSAGLITMSDNGYSGPINATVVDLDGANIAFQGVVNADDILFTVDGDYAISELPFASNSLSITAGGNIGAAETVSYATSLLLNAGLNLTTVDIFTGGDLALTAAGNIGTGNLNSGQSITMNATGNIVSGDLTAGGGVAAGADGDLTVGDVISGFVPQTDVIGQAVVASGENVLLSAGGNLVAQTITSGEGITLDAGGTLTATDLEAVAAIAAISVGAMQVGNASAGQSIALSGGDVIAGNLDAGTTASIDADGDFSVGEVSANAATFAAGGLADFQGVVGATTITVTSGDINIADGGSVGVDGITDLITFNAVSDGSEVILGGDGTEGAEGQYQLAEDGDIVATAVVLNAVAAEGAPAPDIRVLDAEIDGSQTSDGGVASVTLNTDANVFVEGQVTFAGAAATDTIAINAGETIQVITDTGGIVMTDSDGDVSGILELTAHDIWVADQATLDQIAANPTFEGVEDLLSVNNGPVTPEGKIQTGDLTVTMLGSSFLVQNSGSAEEPAGLTVGSGGLSIVNNGSDEATVIIYGRQQGADGSIVTGDAFYEEVEFAGPGGFTDSSNVNGCEVSGGCTPDAPPFEGGVESILGPIGLMNDPKGQVAGSDEFAGDVGESGEEATEEEEEEEGEEEGSGGVDAGSTLINTGPVSIDPPIDQPVTSGADVPTGTN